MPSLDPSELNIILAVLGAFTIIYGLFSVLIKQRWYLGEALPAMLVGIILGPVAAKFLDNTRWGPGSLSEQDKSAITLGFMRVMISVQLVIAGFQLPAKYAVKRWKDMAVLLLPTMTISWLCTTACLMATIPKLTLLASLVIGACLTATDPVLSQAVAKGPFADKYVSRPLREIISAEAGANDGFGFPFLMLATYLMRNTEFPGLVLKPAEEGRGAAKEAAVEVAHRLLRRAGDVGRLDGGIGAAMRDWLLETWLYTIVLSMVYGAAIGFGGGRLIKFCLRKKWIDGESYLLFPVAMAMLIIGTAGMLTTNDLLACFCAGVALNWDGEYLAETEERHDEVNSCIDVLLNFAGFMYVGVIMPWAKFHDPEGTGITLPRLIGLGFMVLLFRRIPAIMATYKAMPTCFGPIGVGAVFYVEHTQHLFPHVGTTGDVVSDDLIKALVPSVYFLVLFSIVVHGLSIPALDFAYRTAGVKPITDDAVQLRRKSAAVATPANARVDSAEPEYFVAYNRFSRPVLTQDAAAAVRSNRRTVLFNGQRVDGLPTANNNNNSSNNGAYYPQQPQYRQQQQQQQQAPPGSAIMFAPTDMPKTPVDQRSRPDWEEDVDPIEEEKIRARLRAASLQKLG
ncbi:Na(+)/H(+) antiporter [Pyricularia oryzae]|nr:Na(+)/H(+) antiporter [Pyricularia oryzae Y34]KAI7921264.1 Na(+)/H(+) antiporter [Pyricularia oryzae]KAI7924062.1 Na(+)/H(+) antiporter [Pyricularia oryzae]